MELAADVAGYILLDSNFQITTESISNEEEMLVMEGWPVVESGPTNRGGVYGNLDEDPELEIIYNIGNKTYAFNMDGSYVDGWPQYVSSSPQYGAPAYGDIDGDGYEEIVVNCRIVGTGNSGKIYAFQKDGTTVTGFPVTALGGPTRTPTLADLDGDGAMEIVVELRSYPDGYVCVYHGDGSVMEGWPVAMDYIPGSAAAVGDITGDDVPEIVAESYYKVWAFDINGNVLEGFPYEPGANRTFSYSSPVLADMDDDGIREIIVGDHSTSGNGAVHIIKNDGTAFPGWPKFVSYWIYGPPSVADIDGDGSPDVVIGDQVLSVVPSDYVYGWNKDGETLNGFPIGPLWAINSQIIVADLDGDEQLELMFDDNTGEGIYNGYNHDGTAMDGWPIPVSG
nr:VCBS repeat-containing protein [Bacteroidota bacterium]